jgi:ketosteroid isomerase-like protein
VAAANRGELDAAIAYFAPDAVWDTSAIGVGTFHGAATIRRFWGEWVRTYAELDFAFKELFEVGIGVVFAVIRQRARPVGTASYVGQREGWVWVSVEGVFSRVTIYPEGEIEEARADAERLAEERG